MRRLTDEQINEIKKLWDECYTAKEIAQTLNIGECSVYKYLNVKEGVLRGGKVEAANLNLYEQWDEVRMQVREAARKAKKKKPSASHGAVFSWKNSRKGEQ